VDEESTYIGSTKRERQRPAVHIDTRNSGEEQFCTWKLQNGGPDIRPITVEVEGSGW
jgi:hypothetical protein